MFYTFDNNKNKYVKIVPVNITELMDPIVLAYMIQGDGNFDKGRNRVLFYTNSYTKEEVEKLALAINNQNSFDAFFFYIIQYIITNLNIFLIIIALSYFVKYIKVIKEKNFNLYIKDIRYIHELKSLFFINPLLAIALSISLFSMAGIGKCSEPLFLINIK